MLQEFTDTAIDFTETERRPRRRRRTRSTKSDAPVVKLVNLIIQEAVTLRASDIHIEPFADRVRIRYRIDGVLVERDSPPRACWARSSPYQDHGLASTSPRSAAPRTAASRCLVAGQALRPARQHPADHATASRSSCVSSTAAISRSGIQDLGFGEEDYKRFQKIIKRPNGIFLVTGPTGSGKTTTLYAALNELNRPDRKIITAEDPVEYYLPGINQCEVKHKIGLDFRPHHPRHAATGTNIILVGEIRDQETAEIAIQASLTGHLVFSTLHTNDAPSAITRLVDIGVQPFLVASRVIAIMAQRLVRVVCPKCKEAGQAAGPRNSRRRAHARASPRRPTSCAGGVQPIATTPAIAAAWASSRCAHDQTNPRDDVQARTDAGIRREAR